jgi:hypothetical protein
MVSVFFYFLSLFYHSYLWSCLARYEPDCLVIGWADRFKICKIIRRYNLLSSSASGQGLKAGVSTVASSIASTVLSSGAGFAGSFVTTSSDKKEMGTHVEIS